MFKRVVFVLCITAVMLSAHYAYGQSATPPASGSEVSSVEKKPVTTSQDKWEFELTPFFWMAGLNGDLKVKNIPADVSMSFSDVMDSFNFGGQVHMEARKGKWGVFLDATYMNLGADIDGARRSTGPGGVVQVEKYLDANINMEQWLVEFGGTYQLAKIPMGQNKDKSMLLHLIGGGRYWYLSSDIDVGLVVEGNNNIAARSFSGSGSKQWVDPFIGLRTAFQLTKDLMMVFRGDIGGFSVGSKFSWNASGYFGYKVSDMVSLLAGYRALYVDYQDGSGSNKFVWDMTMHGPAVGVTFRF